MPADQERMAISVAQEYIYAVARIKARELSLLTQQDIDRLMACKTPGECLRFLSDKGWGNGSEASAEAVFALETEKMWALMHELLPDLSPFDVLLYPIDFNNLKAAVKSTLTNVEPHHVFMAGGTVDPAVMLAAVKNNDFSPLPDFMAEPAEKAMQTLLQTRDGQRCDVILDRASLLAILHAGDESDNELLKSYAELVVALSNIKIAFRSQKTQKSLAFLLESLAPCATLNTDSLAEAAVKEESALFAYLALTPYAAAVEALKSGVSAFEKWCDDKITALVRDGRRDCFTIAPLLAYVIARQNEIATVRIIVSGKQNELEDNRIRARLRETI